MHNTVIMVEITVQVSLYITYRNVPTKKPSSKHTD